MNWNALLLMSIGGAIALVSHPSKKKREQKQEHRSFSSAPCWDSVDFYGS